MIDLHDVRAARGRISGLVHHTPTVTSRTLGELLGTNVYLKLELFQKTGSFKPRGTFNRMLQLTEKEREAGAVAFSGGNFAQAVAYVGTTLDMTTRIIMPEAAPAGSVAATRGYGAEVELVPTVAAATARAREIAAGGATLLHPFDDPGMMAGNGTLGLELVEEVPDVTDVVVAIGGGGFMTGVTVAVQGLRPSIRVWGVETEGADAMALALRAGHVVELQPTSLATTLGAPYVAEDALTVAQERLESVTVVSDAEAFASLRLLAERAKVLPELAAASTLAAAQKLAGRWGPHDHLVLVVCGGNTRIDDLARMGVQLG